MNTCKCLIYLKTPQEESLYLKTSEAFHNFCTLNICKFMLLGNLVRKEKKVVGQLVLLCVSISPISALGISSALQEASLIIM